MITPKLMVLVYALSMFAVSKSYAFHSDMILISKKAKKKKHKTKRKKTKKSIKKSSPYDLGFGIGFFTLYLPQPSINLSYNYKERFNVGVEIGTFTFNHSEFSFSSKYYGFDVKYFPFKTGFFAGLSMGKRSMEITDNEKISVNNQTYVVTWKHNISQQIVAPKAGWMKIWKNGSAVVLSLGGGVPSGGGETTANLSLIPGVTTEEYNSSKEESEAEVEKYTEGIQPIIEVKYFYYLDLVK